MSDEREMGFPPCAFKVASQGDRRGRTAIAEEKCTNYLLDFSGEKITTHTNIHILSFFENTFNLWSHSSEPQHCLTLVLLVEDLTLSPQWVVFLTESSLGFSGGGIWCHSMFPFCLTSLTSDASKCLLDNEVSIICLGNGWMRGHCQSALGYHEGKRSISAAHLPFATTCSAALLWQWTNTSDTMPVWRAAVANMENQIHTLETASLECKKQRLAFFSIYTISNKRETHCNEFDLHVFLQEMQVKMKVFLRSSWSGCCPAASVGSCCWKSSLPRRPLNWE